MTDLNALAIELIVCPRCEARPRTACVTLSGVRATRSHSARALPVEEGWRVGYTEGLRDALERTRRAITRGENIDTLEASLEQSIR